MHLIVKALATSLRGLGARLRGRLRGEGGFAMATVAIAGSFISLTVVVAVTAARGDLNLTQNDLEDKRAYEAARAGLADYLFRLNTDPDYWTQCDQVATPHAVNLDGADPLRTRPVPGGSGASYAIELLPANGESACDTNRAVETMIENSGTANGTFRIRSTGYADTEEQSIVASFRKASFLDYMYFTQLETSDPVTYGDQATRDRAAAECSVTVREGRPDWCRKIYFIDGEQLKGPLHTNDQLWICGQPTFGRTPADSIEVSSPPQGWSNGGSGGCAGANPNFVGTYETNSPVLTPPPTNGELRNIADPRYVFTGQVRIRVIGNQMQVSNDTTDNFGTTMALPPNGVIYVANGACTQTGLYSPFEAGYTRTSECGNAYVSGNYSGRLTIAAENDIIIDGDLHRSSNAMLGLIANNFIRVYHPGSACGRRFPEESPFSRSPRRIEAAMLAIQHSFIVDHYDCGPPLGDLEVEGAISQKYRGPVGTFSGNSGVSGYSKDYTYDDRLRYVSPPHFIDPQQGAWRVQRETLDYE